MDPHTNISPRPQSRCPSIPVERGGVAREEWPVKKILDSQIRVRGGKAILEYLVAWKPTWWTRLVRQSHSKQSRHPSIPVECDDAPREEWPVRKILNSRTRVRGDEEILKELVAWEPTWQPRSNLIPGCEDLVQGFHTYWKDKRPSLTTLAGYRHFKQKRRSRKGGRCKIVKSLD
jgi:hypothetical protein